MNEQFYAESLKVAYNLLKVHISSPFKGDATIMVLDMTIFQRVIKALKCKGCIAAFNQCNTEQSFTTFFKYESYNSSSAPLLSRSFIRQRNKKILRDSKHID